MALPGRPLLLQVQPKMQAGTMALTAVASGQREDHFTIQASAPRANTVHDATNGTLSDAMQDIFLLSTECMVLNWKGVVVPLSYKYELSEMTQDIVEMLAAVRAASHGAYSVQWPSSGFLAHWLLSWDHETLTVDARWTSAGGLEHILNQRSPLCTSRDAFCAEWKKPLLTILLAVRGAGYDSALEGLDALSDCVDALPSFGVLYRDPPV